LSTHIKLGQEKYLNGETKILLYDLLLVLWQVNRV